MGARRCRLGAGVCSDAATCVAVQGVAWLHAKGRAHCDLKGANFRVKLSPRGSVKVEHVTIVDMGFSVKHTGELSVPYCHAFQPWHSLDDAYAVKAPHIRCKHPTLRFSHGLIIAEIAAEQNAH